jgi:hypothetical protein
MKIQLFNLKKLGWEPVLEATHDIRIEYATGKYVDVVQIAGEDGLRISVDGRMIITPHAANVVTIGQK